MTTEYPVYFKQVWTANTYIISVNPELTVSQFIEIVYPRLSTYFEIEQNYLEIVETGKVSPDIIASEASEAIVPSVKKLKELWGYNLSTAAFYVRKRNHEYPQLHILRERIIIQREDECPVCYQTTIISRRYNCIHRICRDCHNECLTNHYEICPVCRSR